jgi:hypothetical protein
MTRILFRMSWYSTLSLSLASDRNEPVQKLQFFKQLLIAQTVMGCDKLQDAFESAKAQWGVIGHGHMILTRKPGRKSDVRSILPGCVHNPGREGL